MRGVLRAALAGAIAGCASVEPPPPTPAPPPPSPSIIALYQQPAERALIDGIKLYEDAAFERSEATLRQALREGLADKRDRAVAYKYLAFITCAFNRPAECEACFVEAFAADPGVRLDDKEIGHPLWGPVYRRVAAAQVK
jgi:hypothetical protein